MVKPLNVLLSHNCRTRCLLYTPNSSTEITYDHLYTFLQSELPQDELAPSPRIRIDGLELHSHQPVPLRDHDFIHLQLTDRLLGGKGGFGTLLRGKGARGPKTSNFESSRDLQGRRLRVARAPERMRQWVEKKVREHEVIKAVGGEDPFVGKALSAEEVVKLYNLKISEDSYNPFTTEDEMTEYQAAVRQEALQAATEALQRAPPSTPSPQAVSGTEAKAIQDHEQHLDSYLDDLSDML